MIKFSQFLQDNEKKKQDYTKKKNEEDSRIEGLKRQIDKKKEQYTILLDKQKRIQLKVNAMRKYENYLENVKDLHQDEYQELSDILSRYETLQRSNIKLKETMQRLEKELDDLKNEVAKYEKDMKTEIMQLNNDIAGLQQQFEVIEDQKNKLKSEAEESSSKKLSKVSELARILMAINNLESRCLNRKEKSALKYPLQQLVNLDDPKNFNMFKERQVYAKAQLVFIEQYLKDFKTIVQNIMEKNQKVKEGIQAKRDNNEII
jgi:chromosome segregation ATPase